MTTPYDKLLARKRSWTPVQTKAGKLKEGAELSIYRALALRQLELPVGEFIKDACSKEIPEASRILLESNVVDEEKHDLALSFIANAIGTDPEAEATATQLRKAWDQHPDHTVVKAMVLERAVFFVILPFFRFNGDAGLRTVSADISRDEQIHVAANTLVCRELGYIFSRSLDDLRKQTVRWIMEPLGKSDDKYLDADFWMSQSDSLLYQGKAEGLTETKRARMPAFFEHSNSNLPQYA
jgi:hypothetical protein